MNQPVTQPAPIAEAAPADEDAVIVIGNGPVGQHFVAKLLALDPGQPVKLFGNEPWQPYDRVRLSCLLAGETDLDALYTPLRLGYGHRVSQHLNCPVTAIDRVNRRITDAAGRLHGYRKLVIATGSRPRIPELPGLRGDGVFTFRDLNDAQRLKARTLSSRHTLVLGGGLLGLETARAMQQAGTRVSVLQRAPYLMNRQLDDAGAEHLEASLLAQGIALYLRAAVVEVVRDGISGKLEGVRLRDGRVVAGDTLVLSIGIQPNRELARDAGLRVAEGICVDDQLRTSDPHIYAIGECAEHRGQLYGLVAPGLEQASVAAHHLFDPAVRYVGTLAATQLKVVGTEVFSVGRTDLGPDKYLGRVYRYRDADHTRALVVRRGRLVGAMAVGGCREQPQLCEAVTARRRLWPWQGWRFEHGGELWPGAADAGVASWPAQTQVCQCMGVTRGQLSGALARGCDSVEALADVTLASRVCGSCRPLLADLIGSHWMPAERGAGALNLAALVTLVVSLAVLLAPAIPFADSVQAPWRWDALWRDGLLKQLTGFGLLGLGGLIALIGLRKRVAGVERWAYASWRLFHVLTGVAVAALLVAHTGLRLGAQLNQLLMLCFTGLMLVGGLASAAIGLQHRLSRRRGRQLRRLSLWLHILLLWPLPALLGFHILKTYWF